MATPSTELLPVGAEAFSVSVAAVGGAVEAAEAATLASPVVATEVVLDEAAVSASELVEIEEDADAVLVEVEVEAAVSASELVEVEEDAAAVAVEVDSETVELVLVVLAVAETVVSSLAVGVDAPELLLVDDALTLAAIVEGAVDGGEPSAIAVAA